VNLASVLSSIELVYALPGQGALMSDDWKWTLKASSSTRPVLRMLPGTSASDPSQRVPATGGLFSDTRGVVNVSAGDPGSLGGASSGSDLGTAFALSTSLLGRNQLQVSGNVGYSSGSGIPTAGFRTSYSRDGFGPEVAVTMQQIYLPARASLAMLNGQSDGVPALRTMSVSMHDGMALTDSLHLDYGAQLDSVSLLDHLNYMSKFARLSYSLNGLGTLKVAYSSGAPPEQLSIDSHGPSGTHVDGDTAALAEDLAALSLLPRVSLLDGHLAVQRTRDMEVGYEKKIASRLGSATVDLTAYREVVTNAAMTMVASGDVFAADVLPDISSRSSILDVGSYHRSGFAASVSQALGDKVEVGASFGRGGALEMNQQELVLESADDVRSNFRSTQRFWGSARASAKLPVTGTQIRGSYQWMDYNNAIMPDHYYLTQSAFPQTGLNVQVRQPIPSFPGMPGRIEAMAEVRNGLAQGYLPVSQGGQHLLLLQAPRALRGGLSFIF